MADFATALLDRFEADTAASALADDRFYWVDVPTGETMPYVRLQTVSDVRPQLLKGPQGFRPIRVQADCFSKSFGEARALAEALIQTVREPATVDGVKFGRGTAEGPRDLGEDTEQGFVHMASVDLLIWHAT